jgi:transposase
MNREDILVVYHQGSEAVIELVQRLAHENATVKERIQALEAQVSQNSRNSSKPPSLDGYQKPAPKSLRVPGERKPGGQIGHAGHTLEFSSDPHTTERHRPDVCLCGCPLTGQHTVSEEKRQVYDLPPLAMEITEHIVTTCRCPGCGQLVSGNFPTGVDAPVQYGPGVRSVVSYLNQYQLLPYKRTQELMDDLFDCTLSVATVLQANRLLHHRLAPAEKHIQNYLIQQRLLHVDETGLRTQDKTHWCHVACTDQATHYSIQPKRGYEGSVKAGVLPQFRGTSMHDGLTSYGRYTQCSHVLCNAHHQRELIFLYEQQGLVWAKDMIELLLKGKRQVEETGQALTKEEFARFRTQYHNIRHRGIREDEKRYPRCDVEAPGKPGKRKQSKAKNLLDRLKHTHAVLAYLRDVSIPYDNNQAERDLRMLKVKQKISGCFRKENEAQMFARIRSYISTAKKQHLSVMEVLKESITSEPRLIPQL